MHDTTYSTIVQCSTEKLYFAHGMYCCVYRLCQSAHQAQSGAAAMQCRHRYACQANATRFAWKCGALAASLFVRSPVIIACCEHTQKADRNDCMAETEKETYSTWWRLETETVYIFLAIVCMWPACQPAWERKTVSTNPSTCGVDPYCVWRQTKLCDCTTRTNGTHTPNIFDDTKWSMCSIFIYMYSYIFIHLFSFQNA